MCNKRSHVALSTIIIYGLQLCHCGSNFNIISVGARALPPSPLRHWKIIPHGQTDGRTTYCRITALLVA